MLWSLSNFLWMAGDLLWSAPAQQTLWAATPMLTEDIYWIQGLGKLYFGEVLTFEYYLLFVCICFSVLILFLGFSVSQVGFKSLTFRKQSQPSQKVSTFQRSYLVCPTIVQGARVLLGRILLLIGKNCVFYFLNNVRPFGLRAQPANLPTNQPESLLAKLPVDNPTS